ncbi:hypothetical protein CQ12_39030 [Bradyrhizobium jicamae]|uniref:Uncharacterized protein n=1 Tax=Bradyrhizobium jicamae TaxID=280332 RepID=A0A0R3M5U1_9BRAD|nr:hypothetical protein [Bradyrhizobium jicamae]KRR12486.1 hypothetical protein CQ12_39030 [Bradyrhizobium jicamae]
MNRLGLILCAIVVWQIAAWAFAPAKQPEAPKAPQRDTRDFGPNEKYMVEGREKQRESAIRALEMPWGSRCSGDDRKQFISGLYEYYYHRNRQTESYPENFGKAGADYITAQWSTADDRRIDRLTQDAYAKGYLKPSDLTGGADKMVAKVVKNERVTGKGCQG